MRGKIFGELVGSNVIPILSTSKLISRKLMVEDNISGCAH